MEKRGGYRFVSRRAAVFLSAAYGEGCEWELLMALRSSLDILSFDAVVGDGGGNKC